MNELPRTINGATLPEGEEWWNKDNLTVEDFGLDHRPMTKTEWERTEPLLPSYFWNSHLKQWQKCRFSQCVGITYRLPSSTPFLMTEKEWTPKFSIGDWVMCREGQGKPFQIGEYKGKGIILDSPLSKLFSEKELTWTLGPSINGHTLQPGQRWQPDSFTKEMLPNPYRPLLSDEGHEVGDEWWDEEDCKWDVCDSKCLTHSSLYGAPYRTTRPLPKVEKPQPESHPAVTEEMVAEFARYILSQPPTDGDLTDIKLALSHAFSQVLPGLQSELQKARAEVADLTRRLEQSKLEEELAWQERCDHKARADKAEASLKAAGYTDRGGECWVPPLGPNPSPLLQTIDELRQQLATKEELIHKLCVESESLRAELATLREHNITYQQAANGWLEKFQQVSRENVELRRQLAEKEKERDSWEKSADRMQEALRECRAELKAVKDDYFMVATAAQGHTALECVDNIKSLRAERDALQWTPLSVRKPTAEDADENGEVLAISEHGVSGEQLEAVISAGSFFTHWRRTNLPVEKVETSGREEFERDAKATVPRLLALLQPDEKDALFSWWNSNKAREVKP